MASRLIDGSLEAINMLNEAVNRLNGDLPTETENAKPLLEPEKANPVNDNQEQNSGNTGYSGEAHSSEDRGYPAETQSNSYFTDTANGQPKFDEPKRAQSEESSNGGTTGSSKVSETVKHVPGSTFNPFSKKDVSGTSNSATNSGDNPHRNEGTLKPVNTEIGVDAREEEDSPTEDEREDEDFAQSESEATAAPQATASQGTTNAQSGASATGRRTTKPAQPSQKEPENTGADEEKFMTAAEATLKAIQEEKKAKDFWEADKKIAAANAAVNVNRAGKETSSRISSDGQTVISSLEGLASAPYLSVRDVDDFGFYKSSIFDKFMTREAKNARTYNSFIAYLRDNLMEASSEVTNNSTQYLKNITAVRFGTNEFMALSYTLKCTVRYPFTEGPNEIYAFFDWKDFFLKKCINLKEVRFENSDIVSFMHNANLDLNDLFNILKSLQTLVVGNKTYYANSPNRQELILQQIKRQQQQEQMEEEMLKAMFKSSGIRDTKKNRESALNMMAKSKGKIRSSNKILNKALNGGGLLSKIVSVPFRIVNFIGRITQNTW